MKRVRRLDAACMSDALRSPQMIVSSKIPSSWAVTGSMMMTRPNIKGSEEEKQMMNR